MKLVTAAEMRNLDNTAINDYGIPGIVLMENAGKSVASKCLELLEKDYTHDGDLTIKRVLIFAGKGNNGGDGFVVARHLLNKGLDVKVFLLCHPSELKGDAGTNFKILQKMNVKIFSVLEEKDLHRVDIALMYADLVVDAIYGTGFKGAATGIPGEILKMLARFKRTVISVDLPSGLEADTGKVNGPCAKANYTLTFGLPKIGLFLEPGANYCGNVENIDISIPKELLESPQIKKNLITSKWCSKILPRRKPTGHKGDYGRVLILGGSMGMTGAISLACQGALRAGAGLVTAGIPRSLNPILEQKLTEAMTYPLPETENATLGQEAVDPVLELAEKSTVVAIGPGMSTHPAGIHFLKKVLSAINVPVVLDADALNLLAKILQDDSNFLTKLKEPLVLTPHPGEMARLTGLRTAEIQEDRIGVALQNSSEWGVTVILKGARTVVACPDGSMYLNVTGNPGMATGGSGDVLTGIIAALIAQGIQEQLAAALGVYLHGVAGDIAAAEKGIYGMAAGDIVEYLPSAIQKIEKKYRNKYTDVVYND